VDPDAIAGRQDRRLVEQSIGRIGEPLSAAGISPSANASHSRSSIPAVV
jgi:hypothetical protein